MLDSFAQHLSPYRQRNTQILQLLYYLIASSVLSKSPLLREMHVNLMVHLRMRILCMIFYFWQLDIQGRRKMRGQLGVVSLENMRINWLSAHILYRVIGVGIDIGENIYAT